jgi:hypothetical protein
MVPSSRSKKYGDFHMGPLKIRKKNLKFSCFFLENVGNLPFRSADLIENDGSNGGSNRRKRM